jgi:quercetin dioxygenase-like cupin family protein
MAKKRKVTESKYEVSVWWLQPQTQGPGAHSHPADDIFYVIEKADLHGKGPAICSHPADDIFYVIEGTMTFLMDKEWKDAPKGSFVLVPGGMTHTSQNRSDASAGLLNFAVPGGFESGVPNIVEWFKNNPPGRA